MRYIYRSLSETMRGYYYAKHSKAYDFAHFHQSGEAFGYDALKWFLRFNKTSKKIVSIHSLSPIQKEKPKVNTLYNLSDAVITNTEYMKEKLVDWGVNETKLHVVPYGAIIKTLSEKPRSGAIMFAGSPLINVKGFEYLAPALKILKNEGTTIQLKLHGYYMPGHQEWAQEIAKKEGIEDIITWLSFSSEQELFDGYQSSMCSVIPYTDYSGAFPAIMAMATGTPVIASDAMGIPEYVNGNGIVVKSRSVSELVDALRKIYNDDTLRQTLEKKGIKLAEEKYCFEDIAKNIIEIYKQ
jgi:glycosyltransferase involved in cell wall biosynthesis